MHAASAPLSAELETALLRALREAWRDLNQAYFKGRLHPPAIALSDAATRLGQWRRETRTIELQRGLVAELPWGQVIEVLKHELAHQYVSEVLGDPDPSPHGPAFRAVCERHGIDGGAAGLPESVAPDGGETRILQRVAKLLALAESPNAHEAELAMAEAQRLLLKHNLEATARSPYTFRHLGAPAGRVSEHERILAGILSEHFFVETIWVPVWRAREGRRGSVLEACGTPVNLEIAVYTYDFLLGTAERLWARYRAERRIRSNRDRRTYLAGVLLGFREKLEAQRKQSRAEGLVWVGDGDLERYWRRRHPHVRWTRHAGPARSHAHEDGRAAGRQIVLHKGVQSSTARGRLLPAARK